MWHPDPDQLALAALPAEDTGPRVAEHLASCPPCRGQVGSLRRTVELAGEHGDAVDDGPGPPEPVWQAISDEPAIGGAVSVVPPSPVGSLDPGSSGRVAMVRAGAGGRMEVTLAGVTDLAAGDYLQVWLPDPADGVALGGLTRDGAAYRGVLTVPAGLPFAVFDTVDVSAERWDGDPDHSQRSILRGELLSRRRGGHPDVLTFAVAASDRR